MASSWRFEDKIAKDTQGLVASGFGHLEFGTALFLQLSNARGGKWLQSLLAKYPATTASEVGGDARLPYAVSLSFTASGLSIIGLDETEIASFSVPFREGMMQVDRLRRLGDRRNAEWQDTVIDSGPRWSGNIVQDDTCNATLVKSEASRKPVTTDKTVHAMLLLYAQTENCVEELVANVKGVLQETGVVIAHHLPLDLGKKTGSRFSHEHFGFADGISQPLPYDADGAIIGKDREPVKTGDHVNGVRLGEILLGYKNGHQEIAPGPIVKDDVSGLLPEYDGARKFRDFGKNGSYVVVRQLRQDVAAFWKGMDEAAKALLRQDPDATYITDDWVAQKVVGRSLEGQALRPDGLLANHSDKMVRNDFLYSEVDRYGLGCPLGSHVRRANPRDSLAPEQLDGSPPGPDMRQTLLDAANNHRILRRGRRYGPELEERCADDGKERGLLFICLNTDIARQFEFTQQTWLLNSDFSTLFDETDPLIGPDGEMTIPAEPLRRRAKVQTFVQLVGGEYFFLPGIAALAYLASL